MAAELDQRQAITGTRTELVALVGLLGGTAVVGIEDPLRGLAEAEIDRKLVEARIGLERRRYARLAPDGFLELDRAVADLVQVVAHPERSYFVYVTHGSALDPIEHGTRRVFHAKGNAAVEVTDQQEPTVTTLEGGRKGMAEAILDFWQVTEQPAAGSNRASLPQAALHEAARFAARSGHAACLESLRGAGVPPMAATALADTLAAPKANAAVIAFSTSAPGKTVGLGMLEGANGLWRMRAAADRVDLEPTTGPALARLIQDFFRNA